MGSSIALSNARRMVGSSSPLELGGAQVIRWISYFLVHAAIGLLVNRSATMSSIHAYVVLVGGLLWSIAYPRREKFIYVASYIIAAEVVWRMTDAQVFHEVGKYSIVLILLLAILHFRISRIPSSLFLYFLFLLPSSLIPLTVMDLSGAREQLSFNMSGPLLLLVAGYFCSSISLTKRQLHTAFLVALGPLVSIVSIMAMNLASVPILRFVVYASSSIATRGYAPNQVSSILGAGVFLTTVLLVSSHSSTRKLRLVLIFLLFTFAAFSALTFSRGGLYSAAFAVVTSMLLWMRKPDTRWAILLLTIVLLLVSNYLLIPRIEQFTGGTIIGRFEDMSLTGRDLIVQADLNAWKSAPVFGVGPGGAKEYRAEIFRTSAAHTEFTRMLAEHGVLGLISLGALLGYIFARILDSVRKPHGPVLLGLITWSLAFMAINAMRMAAPSLFLAMAALELEEKAT